MQRPAAGGEGCANEVSKSLRVRDVDLLLLKVGVYGERIADYTIDFTQVDACAEAFVILCFHKKTIKTLSRKYAFRVKEVSQCDFERKLKACKNDRDVAVLGYY